MNSSLFIGATGMKALSSGMNVIGNNMANVSTYGFKQQNIQYTELMYSSQGNPGESWGSQEDSYVALGQLGHGVMTDSVRTFFMQGGIESTNTVTDLALNGKGFFQVVDENGEEYYTRTGDFILDNAGYMKTPTGLSLTGYHLNDDGSQGALGPIQIDKFETMPPRATSSVQFGLNFGATEDLTTDATNPFFALMSVYDGRNTPPIAHGAAGYQQSIAVYDSQGNKRDLTIYFDEAPGNGSDRNVEFVVTLSNNGIENPQETDGLLMSGVLTFDSTGKMKGISAFTPTGASKDLTTWVPATMNGGSPVMTLPDGSTITLNLGVTGGTAAGGVGSAAEVGTDPTKLGGLTEVTLSNDAITAYPGTSHSEIRRQDGYAEGVMNYFDIDTDGTVTAYYDNGVIKDIWQIPVCRFTSEDGLYRAGGNLYSATEHSGKMEMGIAGTENFGTINAYSLEGSNVDMAVEMVNLIVTQRGFQSNSKVVTTADEMLRKAMEIKR